MSVCVRVYIHILRESGTSRARPHHSGTALAKTWHLRKYIRDNTTGRGHECKNLE